ncbi:hypothetical protein Poli38472_013946 [Pythium oligandrum]|uniref:Uncharacterized protein n=1 Tax=Pythium oligandrum TaxID=41045 RepID=A0A8K1FBU8_PYTOL|nr:hypothetical protein Poli38472_013946 [Pythium oligandrum]|eukprot:TMW55184.1 hypothetical protein Poli38472_013946 [Pythium oligandrum]
MTSRVVARSLRDVARGQRVQALLLARSQDLICKNLMCEHVGSSCACKLSLVLERVPELREMDLSGNQLRFLPVSTFALTQLTTLNVAQNHLDVLSPEIAALTNLETLDVSHNRLQELPVDVLSALPKLSQLTVTGNPLADDDVARLQALRRDIQIIE